MTPARFVVSLDFELYWGVRDRRPLADYAANLEGARRVIPRILELFERYEVRATWAVVGILFADGLSELEDVLPAVRPAYRDRRLDPYDHLAARGASEAEDPLHFAPSLVRLIHATPGQEVATHTFSHFYALEPARDRRAFAADLDAAILLARRAGIELSSIVFPRNQVPPDWLVLCADRGLIAYRGCERGPLYDPSPDTARSPLRRALRLVDAYVPVGSHHLGEVGARRAGALLDIPSSRFLRPYEPRARVLEPLRRRRITAAMDAAARRGRTFHLWWHPHNFGVHEDENLAFLHGILERYATLHRTHGMVSRSMRDIATAA